MKLIDLLVKKTNEEGWAWPGKSTFCYQTKPEHGYITKFFDRNGVKVVDYCWEKCDDASALNELTKEQYESALAASDGWIEWGGGECPVKKGTLVDVRYRDGWELIALPADDAATSERDASFEFWRNDGAINDIISYRLHKPGINSRAKDDRLEQDLNECIGQDVDMPKWSGDGVPPIGCACEMQDSKGTWLPVDIIAKNDGFTFGWSYDYRIVFFGDKADEFRPLRTEAEIAREKLASSLHIAAGASPIELNGIGPLYFKLADAIISGSVFGTTFKAGK